MTVRSAFFSLILATGPASTAAKRQSFFLLLFFPASLYNTYIDQ